MRCCTWGIDYLDYLDATDGGTMDGFVPDSEVQARYKTERSRLLGVLFGSSALPKLGGGAP